MKYACLIYENGNPGDEPLSCESGEHIARCIAYHEELQRKGQLISVQALQGPRTAKTIRTRDDGKLSMTDGPFAETKEQLGGFFLIEARDLDEAIRVASAHPAARQNAIEIRPAQDLVERL